MPAVAQIDVGAIRGRCAIVPFVYHQVPIHPQAGSIVYPHVEAIGAG